MALSDLELLSLVERAQEAKQGPIGPQGVGIRSIEQPDQFTVVISLTDGRTKEINLTAGPKGDPGEAGKPGRDGAEGRPGSAGKAGAAGVGVAGAPGSAGTSIDTAIVNGDGNLLLGLTDGNVLNVGRVVGPAGATGPTGPTGLPGRAGRDGNTILSAPHAPADNEGSEGDFFIDTSSPLFDFYAKGASGWRKLTSLRAPQTNVGGKMSSGGGMSGNGGSGGGELQNTATLPLANPSRYKQHGRALPPSDGLKSQKDLNEWVYSVLLGIDDGTSSISVGQVPPMPSEVGMLWFSTNEDELTLFIYVDDESGWVPAAPPVSLDGINTTITGIEGDLIELHNNVRQVKGDIVLTNQDLQALAQDQQRQDNQIVELEEEIESLAPTFDRGEWAFVTEQPAAGQYAIGHLATSEYCLDIVGKCYAEADDDVAKSQCNRMALECETAEEAGESYLSDSWGGVDTLKIHKLDAKGKEHGFGDWTVGKYVELFNHDDEGYGLFVIDEAAVIEADVATFKVHHVAHEGKPAGVARAKVFEMSSADPTDYVRKTGDTITGTLKIEPTAGITSLTVKSNPELGNTSNIVDVYNNNGDQIFWVDSLRAGYTSKTARPSTGYHLTDKRYVDEAIAAELTAPARLEWQVFVNTNSTPQKGSASLNGDSMSNTNIIRLSLHALNAPLAIKGHGSGLTMYKYSQSPKLYYSTVLSAWYHSSTGWQWKGAAEIEQIKLFSEYIQVTLGGHKWSNMNFSSNSNYRFTVGGYF